MIINFFYDPRDDSHRVMSSTIHRLKQHYGECIMDIISLKDLRYDSYVQKWYYYQVIPFSMYEEIRYKHILQLLVYQTSHTVNRWCGTSYYNQGVKLEEQATVFDKLKDVIDSYYIKGIFYRYCIITHTVTQVVKYYHREVNPIKHLEQSFVKFFENTNQLCKFIQQEIYRLTLVKDNLYQRLGIVDNQLQILEDLKVNYEKIL